MTSLRFKRLVPMALTAHFCVAGAVCLDPATHLSGYKLPLGSEVRTAEAILIGRALSEQGLREDPSDPTGVTAHNVTIEVLATLKGNPRNLIVIRNENTSSRYPMSVGEEHVLFISRDAHGLQVDSCGNSGPMPAARQLVKEIETELKSSK